MKPVQIVKINKTMEIIDKEQLANKYLKSLGFDSEDINKNINEDYLVGFNEAESIYLKQIEELEDKHFHNNANLATNNVHLKRELQEAKELLKEIIKKDEVNYELYKQIEAFLNKK